MDILKCMSISQSLVVKNEKDRHMSVCLLIVSLLLILDYFSQQLYSLNLKNYFNTYLTTS